MALIRFGRLASSTVRGLAPRRGMRTTPLRAAAASSDDRPRTQNMCQGEKVSLFSKSEVENRLGKLRAYMAQNEIGACVMTSYPNINYFSGGFQFCYFGRDYGLVITPDKVTTVSAGIDGGQPWRRSYGDCITYTDWRNDNYYFCVKKLLEGVKGKIGIEFDHVNLDNYKRLDNTLPDNPKVDVGLPTQKMRMIKSAEEIDIIRQGARICDIGGAAIVEALKEDVPEHEVALASTRAMVREIAKTYPNSELLDTWTWFQSGINTDGAHNPVTSRRVQKGDILSLSCFPMIQGYYTALERTLFLNHATDENIDIWEKNCQVHRRGLELIRPGAKCSEIAHELNDIYRQVGLLKYRSFGYGHSFGVLSHYYGREGGLELREHIDTVLAPNMVMAMVPMVMIPEGQPGAGGYREHDILIVKEDGAENITKFPFGPEKLIIKA
ncbi:creatinase-like isoform X3 [Lineus longissimus]